jgi:hypothetical protein
VKALNVAGMPGVRTPPVAISLIALAPSRISSHTAARTASAPSTWRESAMLWPWPPVTVRARPAATDLTRGGRSLRSPRGAADPLDAFLAEEDALTFFTACPSNSVTFAT